MKQKVEERKKCQKLKTVKNDVAWNWELEESLFNAMQFSPNLSIYSADQYFGRTFKYRVHVYPRGIPNTEYRYGSWVILKIFNFTNDTNIQAKYTVRIPSANYMKKCCHIFEENKKWEIYGCKIDELFNPKKKYFVDGYIYFKFEFEFVEIEKTMVEKVDFGDVIESLSVSTASLIAPEELTWSFSINMPLNKIELLKAYENLPNKSFTSDVFFGGKEFKFYFKLFPKLEASNIENGTWLFLYLKNLNDETVIETKYTVLIDSLIKRKYECHKFFKANNEWEVHGIKMNEILDTGCRFVIGKEEAINMNIRIKFAKDRKEVEHNEEEETDAAACNFGNLSFLPSSSEIDDNVTPSGAIDVKNVYFPPTDSWLKSKCDLIGIEFYENVSKSRIPIDEIQKFTTLNEDDVIYVKREKCGYRSLSILLCGNDCYHKHIRRMICTMIIQNNDPKFGKMFKSAKRNARLKLEVDSSASNDERYWMNYADLATAANLFDCNICVLNILRQTWQCFGPKTFENGIMNSFENFDSTLPTILLKNSDENYFSPVTNVRLKWW